MLPCVFAVGLGCESCAGCSGDERADGSGAGEPIDGMRAPGQFSEIEGDEERARAIFEELGAVLQHPRCVNCHPAGDEPLQGERGQLHQPKVVRGTGGMGPPAMRCTSCHGAENFRNVPGHSRWRLAPRKMAWEGKSLAGICRQIKDPERNGGKSLEELVEHMAEDELVGYGWNPPEQLEAVPGTQERFGDLTAAWVEAGAHCPEPSETR